jgi:hypothetical protein
VKPVGLRCCTRRAGAAAVAPVGAYGCVFRERSVGEVVATLKKDPDYLGDGVFKKRNQPPKPATPAGTSADTPGSGAQVAPSSRTARS